MIDDLSRYTRSIYNVQRNLLREVVIKIDFDELECLNNIESSLSTQDFELIEKKQINEIELLLTESNQSIETLNSRDLFIYKLKNSPIEIQICPLFAFITQKGDFENYKGFNSLFNPINQILEILSSNESIKITRIGIRKINSILFPTSYKLEDTINENLYPEYKYKYPMNIINPSTKLSKLFNFTLNNYKVNYRTELSSGELSDLKNNKISDITQFIFDIDVYIDVNIQDYKNHVEQMNKTLYSLFLWTLTDKALQKLCNNEPLTKI